MSEWLTFSEMAEKFGISAEAARQRAIRGNWNRQIGNDGKVIICMPDEFYVRPRKKNKQTNVSSSEEERKPSQSFKNKEKDLERIIAVLESHVGSLEKELSFARESLIEERKIALESLTVVKNLTAELASLRSTAPVVQTRQTETMDQILKRIKEKQAAKIIAA